MHGGSIADIDNIDIDFSVNLNPYMPKDIRDLIDKSIEDGIRASGLYPDIDQSDVRSAIASQNKISPDEVIAGNGASELITAITQMISPTRAMLIEPCFSAYRRALSITGDCKIERYLLQEKNGYALTDDLLSSMDETVDLMFITDPWNPTGRKTDDALLDRIVMKAYELGITVIIDESFCMDKHRKTAYPDNVYAIRSYTKSFALPGIRMGYAVASRDNIQFLRNRLPEWNISNLADHVMRSCACIVRDTDFYNDSCTYINEQRDYLAKELERLGFTVFPSDSMFVLCKGVVGLYEKLIERRIRIRKCDDFYGLGEEYYRIAVRGRKDNDILLEQLGKILEKDR